MQNYNRIEKDNFGRFYYLDDKSHRLDGPAREWNDGTKSWWQNGVLHRIDGPAIEYLNGIKYWYYEDKYIKCSSQEEFERLIKMKLFW